MNKLKQLTIVLLLLAVTFGLIPALSGDFVGQREFRTFAEVLHVIREVVG